MKILHISDIHGNKEALNRTLEFAKERDDLEAIAISGDFPGVCIDLETSQNAYMAFGALTEYISEKVKTDRPAPVEEIIFELAKRKGEVPEDINGLAKFYLMAQHTFDQNADKEYSEIAKIIEQFPQKVMTIPGNWDSPQYKKHLAQYDIHRGKTEVSGVTFAGFGTAHKIPKVLLPTRKFLFDEEDSYNFFVEADPDVAIAHTPPYGYQDDQYFAGSFANLAYAQQEKPLLFLCGHCHNSSGAKVIKETASIVNNSGSIGTHASKHQTFTEIDLDKNKVHDIQPYLIKENEIKKLPFKLR